MMTHVSKSSELCLDYKTIVLILPRLSFFVIFIKQYYNKTAIRQSRVTVIYLCFRVPHRSSSKQTTSFWLVRTLYHIASVWTALQQNHCAVERTSAFVVP